MFANLSDVIKIPAALLIGMAISAIVLLFFYEGLHLPLIGQLINGRVANAAAAAREGYVSLAEKTTAEAKAAEMERQRNAASQALTEAAKRQVADEIAQQAKDAETDVAIADYEKKLAAANRECLADPADVDFLLKH
ncbi:hypothetical protein [Rhizobium sp. SYY.PMSO]|uniref:hypothetical protein n=1 Tax=Rhizobium sp. SYY.PMSO TaxID=3382192 RepID=UPI003990324C